MRIIGFLQVLSMFLLAAISAGKSQDYPKGQERTLDEIKVESVRRAQNGIYPLIGLDPADVQEAFTYIHTKDKDEWAEGFMKVAGKYMEEARAVQSSDPKKADADYIRAWRLYSFGRWPVPSSPKKKESYHKGIEAFLAHAKVFDPPLEVVRIPWEGKEIIGYMRFPKDAHAPVPMVIAVNGLDSRKEDLAESFGQILPYGVGFIAVDGPGTGQAPVKAAPDSNRYLSKVIDYLQTRPEVDKTRIAFHGVSWGAYWAMKMSVVERERLKCVSSQSPPSKLFFTDDFLRRSLLGNREYLFDQVPALMSIFDNVTTVDQLAAMFQKMSLYNQGLLDKPTTRVLIIGGVKDTQVPIADIYTLLDSGDVPKSAWINPSGGHLGRQAHVWPDPRIFKEVLIPWLVQNLNVQSVTTAANEPDRVDEYFWNR